MSDTINTKPGRPPFDCIAIESAIADVKGDVLLLTLAIDDIDQRANEARARRLREGQVDAEAPLDVLLDEDQFTALAHAKCNLICRVRELGAAFYGEAVSS